MLKRICCKELSMDSGKDVCCVEGRCKISLWHQLYGNPTAQSIADSCSLGRQSTKKNGEINMKNNFDIMAFNANKDPREFGHIAYALFLMSTSIKTKADELLESLTTPGIEDAIIANAEALKVLEKEIDTLKEMYWVHDFTSGE